ncbi:hypothetical protein G6F60_015456 [Rhizopus arrhizus]|nr:hypothetical protein G6F60_015456 [Rhizopus arrhizus]
MPSSRCASAAAWARPACLKSIKDRHGPRIHPRRKRVPRRSARVPGGQAAPAPVRQGRPGQAAGARRHGRMARHPEPARLVGQPLARGIRWHRLERHAEIHLRQ